MPGSEHPAAQGRAEGAQRLAEGEQVARGAAEPTRENLARSTVGSSPDAGSAAGLEKPDPLSDPTSGLGANGKPGLSDYSSAAQDRESRATFELTDTLALIYVYVPGRAATAPGESKRQATEPCQAVFDYAEDGTLLGVEFIVKVPDA